MNRATPTLGNPQIKKENLFTPQGSPPKVHPQNRPGMAPPHCPRRWECTWWAA